MSTGSSRSNGSRHAQRPGWLEADDDWDGTRTCEYGEKQQNDRLNHLYFANMDTETLAKALKGGALGGARARNRSNFAEDIEDEEDEERRPQRERPIWAEDDDDPKMWS